MLLDTAGKELARKDASASTACSLHRARGGRVLVALHFCHRGGNDYSYRLTAGRFCCRAFPFGGSRGKSVGRRHRPQLDGTQDDLAIEPKARRTQEIRVKTPRGYSNLVPFDVSDLPDITEAEPNDAFTNAQSIAIPAVVNGRVGTPKDFDCFKFKSDKDQKLVCEVAASRFGSKLDALLILSDTNFAVLQQNDDAMGADARIEFDAKKDTEYFCEPARSHRARRRRCAPAPGSRAARR
jgi:hypothetical protein